MQEKGNFPHKSQKAAAIALNKAQEVKSSKLLMHIPKCFSRGQTVKLANTFDEYNSNASYSFAVSFQKNSMCMLHCPHLLGLP